MSYTYSNSILGRRRLGTPEDPYIPLTLTYQVNPNSMIQLAEVPSRIDRVTIPNMVEVEDINDDGLETNGYFVDYTEGYVWFNHSLIGQNVVASFKGTGEFLIGANRIWTKQVDNNVIETLGDIIESGQTALDSVVQVAEIIAESETAIENAIIETTNAINEAINANEAADLADSKASLASIATANANTAATNANTAMTESSITEGLRVVAEDERVQSELDRVSVETSRINNEIMRTTAEIGRESNENNRTIAENIRVVSENARVLNEDIRETDEITRQTQESTRQLNESNRETEEEARVSVETIRVTAEDERAIAEDARATVEMIRQSQEATRQSQETIRQSQETTRQLNTSIAIANTESATDNAQNFIDTYKHLGNYNASISYVANNEVRLNGSSWRALRNSTGVTPMEGIDWTLVSLKGTDGEGSVSSVNDVSPDLAGNVELTPENIGAENPSNKGQFSGYASLDEAGHVPFSQLGNVVGMELHGNGWHTEEFETVEGAQLKATQAKTDANTYTDGRFASNVVVSETEPVTGLYNGLIWYMESSDEMKIYLNGTFRSVGSEGTTEIDPGLIVQDANHRFVTDAEKTTWSEKSSLALGETDTTAYRGDRGVIAYDHSQATHAPADANNYTHPLTHPPSIIVQDANNRFATDISIAEWNAKETPTGAQNKVDASVGSLGALTTIDKSNIVNAINELRQQIQTLGTYGE